MVMKEALAVEHSQAISRTSTYDEIKPLIDLCKAGKLFEVQEWIAAGKPVNPPLPEPKKGRKHTPLQYAIDHGFHSLVAVLLDGGADIENASRYCPMNHAIEEKRLDIVKLLVDHGADSTDVDMETVFYSWDPDMMEYFIDRGAEVEKGNPLAAAFSSRIRTAMRIFKKYRDQFPSFQEQANIGLRYHCKEGNLKWVSLMLWVGADPYAPGTENYYEDADPDDEGLSAVGFAAPYNHFEVFELRQLKLDLSHPVVTDIVANARSEEGTELVGKLLDRGMDPNHPALREIMRFAYREHGIQVLERLLQMGMNPNDQENGGCSGIRDLLVGMDWGLARYDPWSKMSERRSRSLDSKEARGKIKAIHLLAKHGARWMPAGRDEVNSIRRSLMKMTADYTVEFIWIMSKYQACTRGAITDLLRTSTIRAVVSGHTRRINELVARLPETPSSPQLPSI